MLVKNLLVWFCVGMGLSTSYTLAQTSDSLVVSQNDTLLMNAVQERDGLGKRFTSDVSAMGGGFVHALSRPLHWDGKDFARFGAVAGGIALLYIVDDETSEYFMDQREDVPEGIRDFGWYFGSPQVNYGLTGTIYALGLFTNNDKLRETGVLMITSASAAGLIQQLTKSLTGRARPSTGFGKNHFRPFGGDAAYRSFPSGHTVLSVTTMYALSKQFKSPWIKGACYVVGMVAPVSRLWEGAHWLTDVALSAVMSVAIVESVDGYLKDRKAKELGLKPDETTFKWELRAGPGGIGFVGRF